MAATPSSIARPTSSPSAAPRIPVAGQLEAGRDVLYATYLTWRGMLDREPPRRPEPDRPAGPPSARSESWKFGFVGSACTSCGTVQVPPGRVCPECGAVDQTERRRLADKPGRSPPSPWTTWPFRRRRR